MGRREPSLERRYGKALTFSRKGQPLFWNGQGSTLPGPFFLFLAAHGCAFAELAREIGLEGKMTATTADELFKQAVTPVLDAVGAYPRAEPSKSVKPKQGIRLQWPACAGTVTINGWMKSARPLVPTMAITCGEAQSGSANAA